MYYGQMGGFDGVRKQVDQLIPDSLYAYRKGSTPSEAMFLQAVGNWLATTPNPWMRIRKIGRRRPPGRLER